MSFFNVIAQSNEDTVVADYKPSVKRSESYQSEAELEQEFINMLCDQGYEYLKIRRENDLIPNLRKQLEKLNDYKFTDDEWRRFFTGNIANNNENITDKTQKLQEDYIQVLKRDDGMTKNISLIDKHNVHNNTLQVINQYGQANTRYDVTILVNGLPLVHVELKRRGVMLREAFRQIERYKEESFWANSGLYEYVQIFVISNGTETKYYSNTTRNRASKENSSNKPNVRERTSNSFEFTSYWADANNKRIADLVDFTRTFFVKHTLLNVITKYCVLTTEKVLMVMRPYQITATERIINRIYIANNYKRYGSVAAGGYIWHSTGSGKTLTSFKTARIASKLEFIDKVLFVVDRKDLDYQTMREYDKYEQGAANSNTSTRILTKQLNDDNARIIITTIQKLASFIKQNESHSVYNKQVVMIFDECHRSQFGDMHRAIVKHFRKYYIFGFTGTPIYAKNSNKYQNYATTESLFGTELHTYTIVDAINDKNVLPFRVDYMRTMYAKDDIQDERVRDIDREGAYNAEQRISNVANYILDHFDQKTYRNDRTKAYEHKILNNVHEIVRAKQGSIKEETTKLEITGFNSILAVASTKMARAYYNEFKRIFELHPEKSLRITVIYSYSNEEGDENQEDTSKLSEEERNFLASAISDYNQIFNMNYDTSSEKFQNYYKDVSLRMKNKELDLLIVVNMFLTGFDATTLNTLWVDKYLKMHGLLQAFSRTNRILNSVKTFGNIICFRNLQQNVDDAIALFSNNEANGIILMRTFQEYYNGYTNDDGQEVPGYADMIEEFTNKFPLSDGQIIGEQNQKEFINMFGAILRMRNLLRAFDDFEGNEIISARDFQDYQSKYLDLRDEWKRRQESGEITDISDDVVFELELIKQIEINIDYIVELLEKYHASHCEDKELLITIRKAVDSSLDLRSKKQLIESFIAKINNVHDVFSAWFTHVKQQSEIDLAKMFTENDLKPEETRKFLENVFREGEFRTFGSDINNIMPPLSRWDTNRASKIQAIIDKLKAFFDKYFGAGNIFRISH